MSVKELKIIAAIGITAIIAQHFLGPSLRKAFKV